MIAVSVPVGLELNSYNVMESEGSVMVCVVAFFSDASQAPVSVNMSTNSLLATGNCSPSLPVCLSVCLSVSLSVCLSVRLSICPSVRLSVCLSICLSISLSVCSSVCLSVYTRLFCTLQIQQTSWVYLIEY